MHFTHTIDGRDETSEITFDVLNPATGQVFARCPEASRDQLDRAVAAARRAFVAWRTLSFAERRSYLYSFGEAIRHQSDQLIPILICEQGKPAAAARQEILQVPLQIERICSIEMVDELLRQESGNRIELRYQPLGTVGIITPWNFPVAIAVGRIAQALYTGNTAVQKPSPYTPLSTLKLAELTRDILPPGVLNVLSGSAELGSWLVAHPGIDKISFTGSVATGKKVLVAASARLKRVSLELGGNDAAIVLKDANPAVIAPAIFWAAFANSGQMCVAIKRLYVHESIYGSMCEMLAEAARTVKVGDGLDATTQIGPVQNKGQYDRILDLLEDAKRAGATILAGGYGLKRPGYFIVPTVVANIVEGTRLVDEETFGPVLPILRYRDIDDAISRANATRYGLGASVWTSDVSKGFEVAERLDAGTVWVNQHRSLPPDIPFGGMKESGFGREYSLLGLRGYMEPKVISIRDYR